MRRRIFLLVVVSAALLLAFGAVAALAQVGGAEEIPDPYRGLENPFPWDDTAAQEDGKGVYQASCQGCHGLDGNGIPGSALGTPEVREELEDSPDRLFWILSEGMLSRGMPPYGSSLSEEQRWRVLTYIWSLGESPPPGPSPAKTPIDRGNATLFLYLGGESGSGELTLMAALEDDRGQPITNARVHFFVEADFFTTDLMDIGDSLTNERGIAVLEYAPRWSGVRETGARFESDSYNPVEFRLSLTVEEQSEPFYRTEAGIHLPAPGKEVFIGPESARKVGEMGEAPTSALRLPGGVLSWLWIFVGVLVALWGSYFLVMYQVLRIPMIGNPRDTETKLVPVVGLALVIFTGVALVLMILIGPNSHFHLH